MDSDELYGAGTRPQWSGRVELQHGRTPQGGNNWGAGRERCGARGGGDDASLSRVHVESAHTGGGALAARGNGGAGPPTGAHIIPGDCGGVGGGGGPGGAGGGGGGVGGGGGRGSVAAKGNPGKRGIEREWRRSG